VCRAAAVVADAGDSSTVDAVQRLADRESLVVQRTSLTVTVLNRYPYNNGHLLIAPSLHKGRLDELTSDELLALQQDIVRWVGMIQRRMQAQGFNVGLNLGRVAGAGLPGHLHWHVVPRWNGDTNFMPILGGAHVISQSLDALWEMLTETLPRGESPQDN
jgi:ATP adenylyltransferase